jgi:hypothetical protein
VEGGRYNTVGFRRFGWGCEIFDLVELNRCDLLPPPKYGVGGISSDNCRWTPQHKTTVNIDILSNTARVRAQRSKIVCGSQSHI